jgi:hypothetical protein
LANLGSPTQVLRFESFQKMQAYIREKRQMRPKNKPLATKYHNFFA